MLTKTTASSKTTGSAKRTVRCRVTQALSLIGLTATLCLAAVPAHATTVDTDRPKITTNGYDVGENWSGFGAPLNGAHLDWDEDSNGIVTARLTGYMYINNNDGECAYLTLVYHDSNHNWLGSQFSGEGCADGNRLNKFRLDLRTPDTIASADIDHVTIQLNHRLDWHTLEMVGSKTEYND